MPQLIQVPDVGVVSFPDDATDEQIAASLNYDRRRRPMQADLDASRGTPVSAQALGALGAVGDGINWGFKKANWAMASVPAFVGDVAEGWTDAEQHDSLIGTSAEYGGFRNLKAWWEGASTSQLPVMQDVQAPEVKDDLWANVTAKVSHAGSDLVPRLLVMRGLGAAGAGPATAGAATFGAGEEGFDPKGAVIGAVIPGIQQVAKQAAGGVLARVGGGTLPRGAQKVAEETAGLAAIQAFNTAMAAPEYRQMWQQDREQFWHQLAADTVVNLGFLGLSAKQWGQNLPSETQNYIARNPGMKTLWEQMQPTAERGPADAPPTPRRPYAFPEAQAEAARNAPPGAEPPVKRPLPIQPQQYIGPGLPPLGQYRVTEDMTRQEVEAAQAKAAQEIQLAWPRLTEEQRQNALRGRGLPTLLPAPAEPISELPPPTAVAKTEPAAANVPASAEPPPVQSVPPKGAEGAKGKPELQGAAFAASTPKAGVKVGGKFELVEAGELVSSFDPGYDAALQPRDRSRAASANQIAEIVSRFEPQRLGDAPTTDLGAPFIDARNQVLSGNGRVTALRALYGSERGGQVYADWLARNAGEFGLRPEQVSGMREPVLVRRVEDFGGLDPVEFARQSNQQQVMGMGEAEKAVADAKLLLGNPGLMEAFRPSETGDVLAASNREFLNQFIKGTGDQAELLTREGYNTASLTRRVRNAVLGAVVGPENQKLLNRMIEGADELNIKNPVNGVMQTAPQLLKLKGTGYDLSPALHQAFKDLVGLRQRGEKVEEFLDQAALFGDATRTAESDLLLRVLAEAKSTKAVADFVTRYVASAGEAVADSQNGGMFGEAPATQRQILERLYGKRTETQAEQGDLPKGEPGAANPARAEPSRPPDAGADPSNAERGAGSAEVKAGDYVKLSGGDKFHADIEGTVAVVQNGGRVLEIIKPGDTMPTRVTVEDYAKVESGNPPSAGNTAASPELPKVGGAIGEPPRPKRAADDPGFTAFPVELPEAVMFARDLLGGKYPEVREKLRALGGQAAGVFQYTQGEGAKGKIALKASTADPLTAAQKAELMAQAREYAERTAERPSEVDGIAKARYEFLLKEAYDTAKLEAPWQALKVLWHEIGHAVDWLPDHIIRGRGNLFGRIAGLKNYLKHTIALDPTQPTGEPLKPADKARILKEAEQSMRDELGPMQEIVRTIISEEPIYTIRGVTPEDVKNLFGMSARETNPELYRWFAEQPGSVKKEIVKQAMQGLVDERLGAFGAREQTGTKRVERTVRERVGREPTVAEVQARFQELLREAIRERNLAEISQVKEELNGAIAWWRGTDTMEPYFKTGREMFAESFSIFMNNPAALQERAPTFSRLLWNYLDRKPEFRRLYDEVQRDIQSGVVMEKRVKELLASFDRDNAESMARDKHKLERGDFLDNVRYHFDRRFGPIYETVRGSDMQGPVDKALGDYLYRQSEHELFLNRMNNGVGDPLSKGNLDWNHFGEYLFHKRVIEERFKIYNPLGWNPKNSNERLAEMRTQLGAERFAQLEAAQQNFRALYDQHVVQPLKQSGMFNEELINLIESNIWYSTFAVRQGKPDQGIEHLLAMSYGKDVGPKIYRQVGTVKEIKNPATATVLKALSLQSAISRNEAKRVTVQAMKAHDAANVKEADRRWTGKRWEYIQRETDRVGTITYMQDGKPVSYYVRKVVADAINQSPAIDNRLVAGFVGASQWIKGLYTQLNYGFWPMNFVRDTAGWWMQMPGVGTPVGWAREIPAAIKAARASVKGRPNKDAEAVLQRRMVISRADPRGVWSAAENQYEARLSSYGLNPKAWGAEADRVHAVAKLWNWYRELGQMIERTNKIAAMRYLDRTHPDMPEWKKRQIVRERGGSPDFQQRGHSNAYVDLFAMFYNPWKESLRSVTRSARENPFSFTAKATAGILAPTMVQILAASGAFGDDTEDLYTSVPEYDLMNFLVIPLGWENKDQKRAAYLRLPLWEPARIAHGLLWNGVTGRGKGMGEFYAGTLPSVNSLIDVTRAWMRYEMEGKNPYDAFTGKNWLDENQFAAGGWVARKEMLKDSWNKLGGSVIYRWPNRQLSAPPSQDVTKFLELPAVNNVLGRFVKVSDRGRMDQARRAGEDIERERAGLRLAVQEIVRKHLDGEQWTDAEKRVMREPYAVQYFGELLPKVALERSSPVIRELGTARNKEAQMKVMELQKRKRPGGEAGAW